MESIIVTELTLTAEELKHVTGGNTTSKLSGKPAFELTEFTIKSENSTNIGS